MTKDDCEINQKENFSNPTERREKRNKQFNQSKNTETQTCVNKKNRIVKQLPKTSKENESGNLRQIEWFQVIQTYVCTIQNYTAHSYEEITLVRNKKCPKKREFK